MTFGIGTSQQASAGVWMLMKKKHSLLKLQQVNTGASCDANTVPVADAFGSVFPQLTARTSVWKMVGMCHLTCFCGLPTCRLHHQWCTIAT